MEEAGGVCRYGIVTTSRAVRRHRLSWATVKSAAKGLQRKPIVQQRLSAFLHDLGSPAKGKLVGAWDLSGIHHARLTKTPSGARVAFNYLRLSEDGLLHAFSNRLAPLVMMFCSARNVGVAVVDVSDGEECGPGVIGYCTRNEGAILVPDMEFCYSRGYADVRQSHFEGRKWAERDETIVWRGATTGHGVISRDAMSAADFTLIPRTRMCLLLRDQPCTDVCFAKVVQAANTPLEEDRLRAAGIFGVGTDGRDWWGRKYALDVDGNSNAWSNLFTRLLMGCCVIKIKSPDGYRQWYYDDLRAWEHYVPVASDMLDLVEKVDWCRSHDSECGQIAARGQEFALQRTLETECGQAVARIEAALMISNASR